jgi:hypothetical protein
MSSRVSTRLTARASQLRRTAPHVDGEVARIFYASNASHTRQLHRRLEAHGCLGQIAAALLRAQKASSRAKLYRGEHSGHAYSRKEQALRALCELLGANACGLSWGWKPDHDQDRAPQVFYLDLPNGQVSFHSPSRLSGPDYPGEWDRSRASEQRIIAFAQSLFDAP